MKYLESHSNDPYYNLSFEEYIFRNLPLDEEEYVYLWINSPSIIIGRNQNAYAEINEDYVIDHNLKVCRRITGGGAVYHDLGNLNFSFITKTKGHDRIDFKQYYIPIVNALKKIGINAELSGRNDITIDGKKCIGASQSVDNNRVLSNGCILFNVQLEELAKALNPRKEKLESKGVKSVRARVTNVAPYLKEKNVSTEDFKQILLKEIFKQFDEEPEEYVLSKEELQGVKEIYDSRFSIDAWNYGKKPVGEVKQYKKFPAGFVELAYDLDNGTIKKLHINGDFFGKEDVEDIRKAIEGVEYKKSKVKEILESFKLEDYFGNISADELADLFFQ
ncbi:MAG: lipoate--protein ligase [Lagierella massiliensis]|nr:lipoate--protein ligase [Lagierella massiliensis]